VRYCSGSARAPMSYVPNTAHDIFDGVARAWAVVPCAAPASAPETGAIPTTTSASTIFRKKFMDIPPSFWTLLCH